MHAEHQIRNKRSQKKKNPTTQAHRATQIMQLLVKEDWTMNGSCLTSNILYQATVKCSVSKKEQER